MPKVRYNLQNPKAKETYICLIFRYDRQRLVYYTGDKIAPACWNTKAQQVKRTAACPGADAINRGLQILADKTLTIYLEHRNEKRELPTERFRALLDQFWKGRTVQEQKPVELLPFIDALIDERAGSLSPNTLKTYRTLYNHLKAYHTATRRPVVFARIDLDFHAQFVAYLEKDLRPNTVHKVVKTLKAVMRLAVDRGLTDNRAFDSPRFTARQEQAEHIYLNESDLALLAAADLPERLDRVRDLFLLGCYTGLRFSDYSELKTDNIVEVEGVELFSITPQKTRRRVSVPVLPEVRAILDKYGGAAPPVISNQKFNVYIKTACELAGIKSPVTVVSFVDSIRVSRQVPKFSLVASHTARRTFATIEALRCLREGRSIRPIMDILGHRVERTFWNYVKISPEQSALEFARGRAG